MLLTFTLFFLDGQFSGTLDVRNFSRGNRQLSSLLDFSDTFQSFRWLVLSFYFNEMLTNNYVDTGSENPEAWNRETASTGIPSFEHLNIYCKSRKF
ncbi:hypothetical protein RhiirA4_488789 [Rhizophagus irregularis]|uniref:Uncharacterized protein n=1 Tax=Rhizophagus irregularis TaxID=588596 RepID=A0A2I1HU31_9GLOM|nr:hypothetical protein RhiirA4_479473 [Rhizophagus irregularis]PKY61292.1 hypothetical protein RhiirA4_486066 [Rhizophagus irregularis]PKY62390.1 hypothetical protein RhiirA4_488789 [Rhizophagus irregularis]